MDHSVDRLLARYPAAATAAYFALVLVLLVAAWYAAADLLDRRQAVGDAEALLAQLERGRQTAAAPSTATGDAPQGSPFLEGQTVTVAGAALLQRVAGAVTRVGGNVLSSQVDVKEAQQKAGFVSLVASCELAQADLRIAVAEAGCRICSWTSSPCRHDTVTRGEGGRLRACWGVRSVARQQMIRVAMAGLALGGAALPRPRASPRRLSRSILDYRRFRDRRRSRSIQISDDAKRRASAPAIRCGRFHWSLTVTRTPAVLGPSRRRWRRWWSCSRSCRRDRCRRRRRAPEPPRLSLVGTVAGDQGSRSSSTRPLRRLCGCGTGEGHDGWVLRTVGGREVTLQNDHETAVLRCRGRRDADASFGKRRPDLIRGCRFPTES